MAIALLAFVPFLFAGCLAGVNGQNSAGATNSSFNSTLVLQEVLRLEEVSLERNLTKNDLPRLGELILPSSNSKLQKEFDELNWLLGHKFNQHVAHSLNAMASVLSTGKYVCPADQLSHVRPYLDFNETQRAADAISEGKETLAEWEANAQSIRQTVPSAYPDLDYLLKIMKDEIRAFDAGDFAKAKAYGSILEEKGYC